jgi:hypothetical protein
MFESLRIRIRIHNTAGNGRIKLFIEIKKAFRIWLHYILKITREVEWISFILHLATSDIREAVKCETRCRSGSITQAPHCSVVNLKTNSRIQQILLDQNQKKNVSDSQHCTTDTGTTGSIYLLLLSTWELHPDSKFWKQLSTNVSDQDQH